MMVVNRIKEIDIYKVSGLMPGDEPLDRIDKVVITIPVRTLVHAAQNHPSCPIKVNNVEKFSLLVVEELKGNNNPDTGNTPFQDILDAAFENIAQSGDACIEIIKQT